MAKGRGPAIRSGAAFLVCALACAAPAFAADFEQEQEKYEPPVVASCSLFQGILISAADDCLLIDGRVLYVGGYATGAGYVEDHIASVRATAVNGNANAVVRLAKTYDVWLNYPSWHFVPGGLKFDQAYVAYGGDSFVVAGQVTKSIADMTDDQALNYLGTYYAENDGLGWLYAEDRSMVALQAMADLGNGWSAGVGIEDIDTIGFAVGVINYVDGMNSGHLTILGPDLKGNDAVALHTGITLGNDSGTVRVAYAQHPVGGWGTLASGQVMLAPFTLSGSVETGSSYGWKPRLYQGFGVSAAVDLGHRMTASVGARWADEDVDMDATESWQYATELAFDFAETMKAVGEVGLHRTTKLVAIQTISYASAKLRWQPGGQTEMWGKYLVNSVGAYRVIFQAEKTF